MNVSSHNPYISTNQVRRLFLDFFAQRDHTIVASSSLIPNDDPSLLFTNSGMVQFKKAFLQQEVLPYKRAVSCQRCLRAGGKHNDLENVGFTSRHHTFFEMLGNFSFGDYFKREAIFYAWEFITKYLKIPAEKLWITVYKEDLEAEYIWLKEIKIDPARFARCDMDENFWSMGDTGPCGPCSEIYYDHGCDFEGEPPGVGDTKDRYIEIYNLVFMQYNREINGELKPLPNPCIDTGMGLERVAAVMQAVHNNYDIDLFAKLIKDISKLFKVNGLSSGLSSSNAVSSMVSSLRVIADHLRACAFLVVDGIIPANEGRGYVLRRILRRAIRHGYKLGKNEPFFYLLVPSLIQAMGEEDDDFAILKQQEEKIREIFLAEEIQFAKTLEYGMKLLMEEISRTSNKIIAGGIIFRLYDTYGFPVDLTMDIAREYNMQLDLVGFEQCMVEQRNRARKDMKFQDYNNLDLEKLDLNQTNFIGYEENRVTSKVLHILSAYNNQLIDKLVDGEEGKIILEVTPFYAESGGQVGDIGYLYNDEVNFLVNDTKKFANTVLHIGKIILGKVTVGDILHAEIDVNRRNKIRANHSATHLLHAALRNILGLHVKQKGSLVEDTRLRFDFEHNKPLTREEILSIELQVNEQIRSNQQTKTEIMSIKDALDKGAVALFDDKYKNQVRVLNISGGFSLELCGGTHVNYSGDIGGFKIITEEAVASGVRRIEAITGEELVLYGFKQQNLVIDLMKLLKISSQSEICPYIQSIIQANKDIAKKVEILEKHKVLMQIDTLKSKVKVTNLGVKFLVTKVDWEPKYLKFAIDYLKQYLIKGIVILGCEHGTRAFITVGVTKNLIIDELLNKHNRSALDLIKEISAILVGKGGGRDDLAEASGNEPKNLQQALNVGHSKIIEWLS